MREKIDARATFVALWCALLLLKAVVADDQLQTALAQQQTLGREGPQVGRGM